MQKYALSLIHRFFRLMLPKHSSAWTTWLLWRTRKELALMPLHDLDTRQLPLMGYHQHQEFARYRGYREAPSYIITLPPKKRVGLLKKEAAYPYIIKNLP